MMYLALLTKPAETGQTDISEPSTGGYSRMAISNGSTAQWENTDIKPWPIAGFAVLTASVGGEVISAEMFPAVEVIRLNDSIIAKVAMEESLTIH